MTDYKCGHKESGLLVIDGGPTSMSKYLRWAETVGLNGTREQCWECWCEKKEAKHE